MSLSQGGYGGNGLSEASGGWDSPIMLAENPLGFVSLVFMHTHHTPGRLQHTEGKIGELKDKLGGMIIRGCRMGAVCTVFDVIARCQVISD